MCLEDVPLATKRRMLLQNDGAPPHFGREATELLKENCKGRRIGDVLEGTDRCVSPLDCPT
jgi:hypothetical protein